MDARGRQSAAPCSVHLHAGIWERLPWPVNGVNAVEFTNEI